MEEGYQQEDSSAHLKVIIKRFGDELGLKAGTKAIKSTECLGHALLMPMLE